MGTFFFPKSKQLQFLIASSSPKKMGCSFSRIRRMKVPDIGRNSKKEICLRKKNWACCEENRLFVCSTRKVLKDRNSIIYFFWGELEYSRAQKIGLLERTWNLKSEKILEDDRYGMGNMKHWMRLKCYTFLCVNKLL